MSKNNSFKNIIIIATLVVLISVIGGSFIFFFLTNHNSSYFRDYFAFGDNMVTVQDDKYQPTDNPPVFVNDEIYISYQYVKDHIDKFIYWDSELGKLTITTSDEVIRFKEEDTSYFVNGEPFELDLPVKIIDGAPYLPKSLIESLYPFQIEYIKETNIVRVYDKTLSKTFSKLKSGAILRYEPNRKGVIEAKLKKGNDIQVFDEYEDYTKIVTYDGLVGYVKTSEISKKDNNVVAGETVDTKSEYETKPLSGKVNVVWDMITNTDANGTSSSRTNHEGVNVLAPTWFKFDRDKLDGTIISYADKDYVNYAHNNGYMVWGLVSDVADTYDTVVLHSILPNSNYRERAIKQLLSYMTLYELDGLNIDFEVLKAEDSDAYVQFFRELYPYMKKEGKYLSVDTYVPSDWSTYFRREDVAESVDYFMIMAYDEHNPSTSEGPVASYDFVEQGIIDSLELIPKEKLILGVPFYTRIWKTQVVDGKVTTTYVTDLGMDTAKKRFDDNNAKYTFDADSKYTYGEYTTVEDGNTVTYKAWLEDLDSLKLKIELANKYDLKGVAGWRRGLQGEGVFKMINQTLK